MNPLYNDTKSTLRHDLTCLKGRFSNVYFQTFDTLIYEQTEEDSDLSVRNVCTVPYWGEMPRSNEFWGGEIEISEWNELTVE